ncbi:protein DEFECTIVE IN MERISTEM SILENCING 3-like isoform X2 [Vicia villosa]|uniref:protein DEFECTIVE IN MERISTEM SILENCING 3-like isoform X2 n=2 Tax=Vicia villosa TaxID=3911 RepID=UPI00273AF6D7|nr:protein DEFECTIVE IN MERISTEM SILENCING 3-like isoform X2 [Vicia villosa]
MILIDFGQTVQIMSPYVIVAAALIHEIMSQPTSNSSNQHLVHTMPVFLQGTSASVPMDMSESSMDTKDNVQNRELINAENSITHSKKLEDELLMFGKKIKQHEKRVNLLNREKVKLDGSIIHLQVAIGKSKSSSATKIDNAEDTLSTTEEEVLEQILQHERSAAGVLCHIKTRYGSHASLLAPTKDILGIVPMLGRVEDDNLNRLFSEYLGVETMLAIVCKTYEGVQAIEMYDKEGCINKSRGLHGLGASIGKTLDGRFLVICLESLRPYEGKYVVDDPHRRLDILNPRLPNGECPAGFLGFAVNMINIDTENLFCVTQSGFGLRETLFYNLFSCLQVYKTGAEMVQALPFITDGALSLDGGMIRGCGVFSFGKREDVNVRFPKPERSAVLDEQVKIEKELKDAQREKEKLLEDLKRENTLLDIARLHFTTKKNDFLDYLASSSKAAQRQLHNAARSMPR